VAVSVNWSSWEDHRVLFVNGTESGNWHDSRMSLMFRQLYPNARQIAFIRSIHIHTKPGWGNKHSNNFGKIWAKQHSKLVTYGDNDVVVFMDDNEGISQDFLPTADRIIPHLGDSTTRFVYLAGCFVSERSCNTLKRLKPNPRMDVYFLNSWESACSENIHITAHIQKDQPKTKTFLTFNRHYRDPRVMFVGLLKHHGLMKKGFVSVGATFQKDETEMSWETYWPNQIAKYPEYYSQWDEGIMTQIKKGWEKYPTERNRLYFQDDDEWWDGAESYAEMRQDHPDVHLYESSHLFVVTETGFQTGEKLTDCVSEDTHFLTEKTYRQIGLRMPIIVVGRPGIMAQLQKAGYQSYHPHIDETYDTLENDGERMMAIINELKRLSEFTDEQWEEWHKEVDKIADFNYNVLESKELVITQVMEAGNPDILVDGRIVSHSEYKRRREKLIQEEEERAINERTMD